MLSVKSIGTCRVTNPLRLLAQRQLIELDQRRLTGFVHTSSEVVQQIRFMLGSISYPPHLHDVIGQFVAHPRCRVPHVTPSRYVVEISSAKRFVSEGFELQQNFLFRVLDGIFGSPEARNAYLATTAPGSDPAARQSAMAALGTGISPDRLRLLRTLEEHRITADYLRSDLAAIAAELDAPFLLVTHVGATLPGGGPLLARDRVIADVKREASALGIEVYDPTADKEAFGQDKAMAKDGRDLAHYTPGFTEHLARVFAERLGLGEAALARLRKASAGEGAEDTATPAHMIAAIPALAPHAERIALPLTEMIESYLGELEAAGKRAVPLRKLIAASASRFDPADFEALQAIHLDAEALTYARQQKEAGEALKYLDFPFFLHKRWNAARRFEWGDKPPLRVLELGCSAGYLGLVAAHLGHDYLGLDADLVSTVPGVEKHLADDLADLFAVPRICRRIEPLRTLDVPGPFDAIVCLEGAFSARTKPNGGTVPWSAEEWEFFIDDLLSRHLKPGGTISIRVGSRYWSESASGFIEKRAAAFDRAARTFSLG